MNESSERKTSKKQRWMLIGIAGLVTVAGLLFLLSRSGWISPKPRHLSDRWQAGDFDLPDDERERLRELPVQFASSYESCADAAYEQPRLADAHIIKWQTSVKRREQLPVFQKDPDRKVAVTSEQFRHFYQAYANQDHPVFITSDSILNAFHRILEDAIVKLEFCQIERLQSLLPAIEKRLSEGQPTDSDSEIVHSAHRRAQTFIGVASQLIDPSYEPNSQIRQAVQEETKRIESGTERSMPQWLGKPRPTFLAIDYSRFTPQGLHTRGDTLRRHYRAVRWLQTIPFFADDDEHLISLRLIGEAAKDTKWDSFAQTYREFFGDADDWDLQTLNSLESESNGLPDSIDALRKQLLQRLDENSPSSKINDLVAYESAPPKSETLALRALSAFQTPEAILFQWFAGTVKPNESVGLQLCAALGSQIARKRLVDSSGAETIATIDRFQTLLADDSVYGDYLQCLATLLKPIRSAPEFMSTDHWQLKSCQTVLGGWTQMRHTFALQAKQNQLVLNMSEHVGAGFVEPNPEFFRRLGQLASRIETSLHELGAFEINYEQLCFRMNELARCIVLMRELQREGIEDENLAFEDKQFVDNVHAKIGASEPYYWVKGFDITEGLNFQPVLAAIVQISDCVERGELPTDRAARGALLNGESSSNRAQWLQLVKVCGQLADVAGRQLDKQPLTTADEQFITNYGTELARLLKYESHSASYPVDDAMRCVSVLTHGNDDHVHIAVARPQAIYVLYPDRGQQLLCRGTVFPYFEFTDKEIVNDQSWKTRIDTSTPERPHWLKPIYTNR